MSDNKDKDKDKDSSNAFDALVGTLEDAGYGWREIRSVDDFKELQEDIDKWSKEMEET